MQKQILAAGFFLLSLMLPMQASAHSYEEIYIFGDSFSDTGNLFNFSSGAIPPSPAYFDGNFSNGPLWVEYLASNLNLTVNPHTNFAFGGATTGFDNLGLSILPGLQQQINDFTTTNLSANSNALYILWAGTNDYLDYFFNNLPNPKQSVANLSTAITSLAAVGAQDIMVLNLPDLGKFPVTGGDNNITSALSNLINLHNLGLATSIDVLSQQLSPEINIISVDVNSLFNQAIADPAKFNLTNVTDSCVGNSPVVPITIPTQPVLCIPDKFLFWDEVHPTTTTHQLIGKLAFSALGKTSIPEPSCLLGILAIGVSATLLRKDKLQSKIQ
ncbi:SGNH/GDSL hydrolase family protein [Anabaena cylindrica FACHB-243]|uniref:Lipolytic protein G-D-S-L family n=1 Tax=Anabaena cylindrica (strain ATCC 27899 / PCC 7122) TaxID=272123 RepID=K9ZCB9_ANACC|nr:MULTISPECIES: SGNH/GDSL hydrolase family protein [Anabaena]AFZ56816.1 lipolytic protein G-D-S-L family [Anabaena cylindrica PCC 7122]MBD2418974.1 SGNH/GDSL hydrolase family protein [Anabaena cylindrica FACHB-243]MBY5285116.1 SGNH/GDSL hydrolase family protein [Anabaena sp. CCAP 1446/1C]MBY5308848.1 SGNH/GDSL hydrolase family protein [Anabaena sp. CCAP 1446/1C]MCM2409493.1 SGNH/GDSL hydrolase family protein [Anabaena sp. CCAP 1446/1C]